jgi:hypothetical protein
VTRGTAVAGLFVLFLAPAVRAGNCGLSYCFSGAWAGGAAVADAHSTRRVTATAGQPAVGHRQFTVSFFLRPGFHQSFGSSSSGDDPGVDRVYSFSLPTGCLEVSVPAGCFTAPYTLAAVVPGFLPEPVSPVSPVKATGVSLELTVSPTMTPRKPLAVTACYRDQDVTGAQENRLKLATFPGNDVWTLLPTSIDPTNNLAAAASAHLGLWRLLEQVPAEGLGSVAAYPNPLSRGAMTFSGLPAGARLRLYSFDGTAVRELASDGAGQASWDGRNGAGEAVASGTYFVFIDGAVGERTLKVQVQR